jgi:hypothetical protein
VSHLDFFQQRGQVNRLIQYLKFVPPGFGGLKHSDGDCLSGQQKYSAIRAALAHLNRQIDSG